MSPKKQRIAIAKACGWRIYKSNGVTYYERPGENVYDHVLCVEDLPDYLNDLNTIHEVEAQLINYTNILTYLCELREILAREKKRELKYIVDTMLVFTTASQRAEAFLKTLNLWKK